jgi:drug/metabolite transporter (DMT)-like permease
MKNDHLKAVLYLVVASILWSSGGVLIKLVNWNSIAIAGVRSGIAAVFMMFYLRKVKIEVTKVKLGGAVAYAATVIFFVVANKLTTSANAILLQYTAPIWVAVFSGIILKEKAKKVDWISILFVMIGMMMFFIGDVEGGKILGNGIAVMSGIALSFVAIFLKLQKDSSPVEMTYLGNIIAFLVSIPFLFQSSIDLKSIIGLLLLGIFQLGISYILYAEASRYLSAIEAILITVIEPLLNPIWAFIFIGENPGYFAVIGGVIVVGSVISRNFLVKKLRN